MKKQEKIIFIIPAFNEEENILNTYKSIKDYNKKNKIDYDVIVINDGSTDNTQSILEKNKIPHINLIRNLGIGGAVQTGFKYAIENNYDVAIQFDGDGQHDIKYAKEILKPILDKKANMVIGSRFIDKNSKGFKSSFARRIGIKLISLVIKLKTGKKIYDTTSGFRAIDKNILKIFSENYPTEYPEPISSVTIINKGLEVDEVPVEMKERGFGKSSIRTWKNLYYMFNVIISILIIGKRVKK